MGPVRSRGTSVEEGFTLVEIVLATGLVGIVALSVVPLILMAVQTSAVAQEATELTNVARTQVERLRALPFDDAALAPGGSLSSSAPGYSLDPLQGDENRYLRWQIVQTAAFRKHIRIVGGVRESVWGPPREIHLETYRTVRP